jgi:hypothetical protein
MRKLFTLLTFAACVLAFLILAPVAPAQNPEAEAKVIAVAQQLKLTPQQEVEVLPILKAEAPKFEAIKSDPSMSGMQKMKALRAIHAENAPQFRKFLPPRSTNSCRLSARPTSRRRSRPSAPVVRRNALITDWSDVRIERYNPKRDRPSRVRRVARYSCG